MSQRASAEPGKYKTSRTPYMCEIMDLLSVMDPTKEIVLMKSAQIGATEAGNNWIGYVIDHSPAPMLVVSPTVEMAKRNSKQRIDPLIEESPRLRSRVSEKKSKDSSNTILNKDFPGGTLVITGANSAVGLRSMPARFLFLDEIDGYPLDADGEGNPIDLAKARSRTFSKRKLFMASTPTISGQSHIEAAFDRSDKRYYHVPCPHCGDYQILTFKSLIWPKNQPEKAKYKCEGCEKYIENWQKTDMLASGRWIASDESEVAGFHINALYSPVGWYSWSEIAKDFLAAKRSPETLRSFINTVLGEAWKEKTERPDWHRLYERRESYPIESVPKGGIFLTCGVDVQKDRIEAEIVAWGKNKVSWSVAYRIIRGDTSDETTWAQLSRLLDESWPVVWSDKIRLPIKLMAVDSGYNTSQVYNWTRQFSHTKVVAVKGRDNFSVMVGHPKPVDISLKGKTIKGSKVWPVGVSIIKTELYGWLGLNAPKNGEEDPFGYCHFPEYEEEFFKQLTAEHLVTKLVKGYKKREWQKVRDRNEVIDCRTYARAAAFMCGIDRYTDETWSALESEMGIMSAPQQVKVKRRPSRWL